MTTTRVRSFFRELRPQGRSVVLGLLALGMVLVGLLLGLAMGFDKGFKAGTASGITSGLGFFGLFPAALLFGLSGLLEKRPLSRSLWFGAGALAITASGLLFGIGVGIDHRDPNQVLIGGLCCGALPASIFGFIALLSLSRGLSQLRSGTAPGQVERVRERVQRDGAVSFQALALEAGIREDQVPAALAVAAAEGLYLTIDQGARLALQKDFDQEGIRRLPGVIQTAGRISLEELSREFCAPVPAVRRWVQENVGHGRFHGAIDWKAGVLFASDSATLKEGSACPSCGGRFVWVGKGLLRCPHCDAQIVT